MKKILTLIAAISIFFACQKEDSDYTPQQVSFTIGLQLPKSGSMVRSAEDLYADFYTNYISNKVLIPENFELTIYKNDEKVGDCRGVWEAELITLEEGTYRIVGTSKGDFKKASLSFDQEVTINKDTKSIKLTAIYDCYMLFFEKEKFNEVSIHCDSALTYGAYTSETFPSTEKLFYLFLPHRNATSISYEVASRDKGSVYLKNYSFVKGRYYMFDIISGEIYVPQMESGN